MFQEYLKKHITTSAIILFCLLSISYTTSNLSLYTIMMTVSNRLVLDIVTKQLSLCG